MTNYSTEWKKFASIFVLAFSLVSCAISPSSTTESPRTESPRTESTPPLEDQRPIKDVTLYPEIKKFSGMLSSSTEVSGESEISGSAGVDGWYLWSLAPHKDKTKYYLRKYQGKTVIHARSSASASGLIVPLKARPTSDLDIIWSWKALKNISTADNTQGHTDDAPLRLVLGFEGDKSTLSLKDQLAFEMAKLISGHDLPYATLMYIWSEKSPVEEIITNKHLSRIKAIVVDSGAREIGQWRSHHRSIEEDFKRAYGEKPGRLIAVGIMTDTDNTKSEVQAIYGDIELHHRTPKTSTMATH